MHFEKTDQSSRKCFRPYANKKIPVPSKENTRNNSRNISGNEKDCTNTNSISQIRNTLLNEYWLFWLIFFSLF